MSIYTPYTYLIGWSHHNMWYYGVRYSKKCSPDDLWTKYFTSSKHVKSFRKQNGEPDVVQIRKTFSKVEDAQLWEHKVLRRIKAVMRKDFLNKTDNKSFGDVSGENNPMFNRKHTEDTRLKLSLAKKGKSSPRLNNAERELLGLPLIKGRSKGSNNRNPYPITDKVLERIKNRQPNPNFVNNKPHTQETKNKLSDIAKNRESFHCACCEKTIKGKMNWDRHLVY